MTPCPNEKQLTNKLSQLKNEINNISQDVGFLEYEMDKYRKLGSQEQYNMARNTLNSTNRDIEEKLNAIEIVRNELQKCKFK